MSGLDYDPRIYIRGFTPTDFRAFVTTLEYDVTAVDTVLLRDLFLRVPDETTGRLLLAGDAQSNGDVILLSGDSSGDSLYFSDRANFRMRGIDATLSFGFRLEIPNEATFALVGRAAGLLRSLVSPSDDGEFAVSGVDVGFTRDLVMGTVAGQFALSGQAIEFQSGFIVEATSVSYAVGGTATTFRRAEILHVTTGAHAFTGRDVSLFRKLRLEAATTTYTLTGSEIATSVTTPLSLSGDMQSGADKLELSGDEQSGTDLLLTSS